MLHIFVYIEQIRCIYLDICCYILVYILLYMQHMKIRPNQELTACNLRRPNPCYRLGKPWCQVHCPNYAWAWGLPLYPPALDWVANHGSILHQRIQHYNPLHAWQGPTKAKYCCMVFVSIFISCLPKFTYLSTILNWFARTNKNKDVPLHPKCKRGLRQQLVGLENWLKITLDRTKWHWMH